MTDELMKRLIKQFERQPSAGEGISGMTMDPGSPDGDFSASTVACGPGITADEVRKALLDIQRKDINFRPPSAILFYGSAYDDLLKSLPMEPFVPDSGGINFKIRFEGIPIIRMPNFGYHIDGAEGSSIPKPVVWPDVVPIELIKTWQCLVAWAVVALILVMLGGVV